MSNKKFYEEECLPLVKRIAEEITELADNPMSKEEAEERVKELEEIIVDYECEEGELTEDEQEDLKLAKEEMEELNTKLINNEPFDLYDYFEDCLDIEYRIDSRGEYKSVAVTITTGGPHIEVDTEDNAVKLWWGGDKAEWPISYKASEIIDSIFEEHYNCLR